MNARIISESLRVIYHPLRTGAHVRCRLGTMTHPAAARDDAAEQR
jgi:hypothetical protein